MASLNTNPGSSTAKQRKRLVIECKHRNMTMDAIREMAGGRLHDLSTQACSDLILHVTGKGLANPPGQKPKAYQGRPAPGVTRMISDDQVDQISRLAVEFFDGDGAAALNWLRKNFKVTGPRDLGTAKRGGEVIAVLKGMNIRKGRRDTGT